MKLIHYFNLEHRRCIFSLNKNFLFIAILNNSCALGEECIGGTICDMSTLKCICLEGTIADLQTLSCVPLQESKMFGSSQVNYKYDTSVLLLRKKKSRLYVEILKCLLLPYFKFSAAAHCQ